ncbi:MAG: hypothetical protein J6I96_05125 [Oscillospiraceae bacterium]|nr:hypothetical protein [Oscillospiraceae bacterium]
MIITDIDVFTAPGDGEHKLDTELSDKFTKLRESLASKTALQEKQAKAAVKKLTAERTQLVCDRDRVLYCLNNTVYRG